MKSYALILVTIMSFLALSCSSSDQSLNSLLGEVHTHQDFKIVIHGQALDFTDDKYQSTNESQLSPFTHLHDGDGEVIHVHIQGVTLGEFLSSLGITLTDSCITLDDETNYCEDEENKLTMLVNGQVNEDHNTYFLEDLDRILISYGQSSPQELEQQMDSVTDKACIQSGSCPERGSPSDESSCLSIEGCTSI